MKKAKILLLLTLVVVLSISIFAIASSASLNNDIDESISGCCVTIEVDANYYDLAPLGSPFFRCGGGCGLPVNMINFLRCSVSNCVVTLCRCFIIG